jgi:hypothetical protein
VGAYPYPFHPKGLLGKFPEPKEVFFLDRIDRI